MQIGDIKEQL